MALETINFGDVFNHKECEYIFLDIIEDRVYTARILSKEQTQDVEGLSRISSGGGKRAGRTKDLMLLCYIILSTEEFRDRAACYALGSKDDLTFDLREPLNQADQKSLKEAIIKDKNYIAPELIEKISKLT